MALPGRTVCRCPVGGIGLAVQRTRRWKPCQRTGQQRESIAVNLHQTPSSLADADSIIAIGGRYVLACNYILQIGGGSLPIRLCGRLLQIDDRLSCVAGLEG
jgi:hypothetical protein